MEYIEKDWRSVEAYNYLNEQEMLEKWARLVWERGGEQAIEIGCYKGACSILLSQFFCVEAIDLFGDPTPGRHRENIGKVSLLDLVDNLQKHNCLDRVFPTVGTSSRLKNAPFTFDFAFIDGDHDYEAVKNDFINIEPCMVGSGMIVFHDYKRPTVFEGEERNPGQEGVEMLVQEILSRNKWVVYQHYEGQVAIVKRGWY